MSTPDKVDNLLPPPFEGPTTPTPPGVPNENTPMSINSFFYTVPTTEEGLAARQAAAVRIMNSPETFDDLPDSMQDNVELIGNDPHVVIDIPAISYEVPSGTGDLGEAAIGAVNGTEGVSGNTGPGAGDHAHTGEAHADAEVKGSLEGLPEDAVPIFPGDGEVTIDVAHIGWNPSSDVTLLRTTEGVKLATSYPTPDIPGIMVPKDEVFRAPDAGPATRYAIVNGMPTITYTYDSVHAAEVNRSLNGGPGRPKAGFMLFGERGSKGLNRRLALRLIDTEQEGLRTLDEEGENGVDPLNSEIKQLKLDELKHYQKGQREEVYRLLADQGSQERLIRMLAAALQSPVHEGTRQRNLYMSDTSERVGHAILYALDDMLSIAPEELQDAIGGDWTFATAVNPMDEEAGAHHENNLKLRFDFSVKRRVDGPPQRSIPIVPPLSRIGSEFTRAATRLVSTYLEGGSEDNTAAKQRVANLVSGAGQFDPRDLKGWCERLAPAA